MSEFKIGDRVRKLKGYEFESEVRSVFSNTFGEVRLVCESLLIPGMLHIFSPSQMAKSEANLPLPAYPETDEPEPDKNKHTHDVANPCTFSCPMYRTLDRIVKN